MKQIFRFASLFLAIFALLTYNVSCSESETDDDQEQTDPNTDDNGGSTEGDGTEGDGTEGDGTEGDGTEGDGTEGDGTEGDGTEGDGTEGDGTEGDGTEGDGTEGDGTEGDGTEGDGTEGDGTEGDGTEEEDKVEDQDIEADGDINNWENGELGSGGFDGQVALILSSTAATMGDWADATSTISFTTEADESTIEIINDNSWFTANLAVEVDGYGIVITSLSENNDSSTRTGTFTINVGDQYNGNSATITVSQDGADLYVGKLYMDDNGTIGMVYYMDTTYAYAISVEATTAAWALDADLNAIDSDSDLVLTGDYHAIGAGALLDVVFPTLSDYDGGNGYPAYKWVKETLGSSWMLPTRYDWQTAFHECGLSEDEMNAAFLPNGGAAYDLGEGSSNVRYWTCHTNSGGTKARYYNPTTGKASETTTADTIYGVRGVLYIAL